MAFDDLLFVGVCFPVRIYSLTAHKRTFSISKIFYDFSSYLYCVYAGFVYYCCPNGRWEILCHLLASETSNNFNASMACYFDGVDVSFSSHGFSATPHQLPTTGSECFHLFLRFVSSCDYLLPQHQYLEKSFSKKLFLIITKTEHSNSKTSV